jgi:hypothetical protein
VWWLRKRSNFYDELLCDDPSDDSLDDEWVRKGPNIYNHNQFSLKVSHLARCDYGMLY